MAHPQKSGWAHPRLSSIGQVALASTSDARGQGGPLSSSSVSFRLRLTAAQNGLDPLTHYWFKAGGNDYLRLVANAGLILPATLAQHLGLPELADTHLDLGDALGRANTGDKMMMLVASALAGGDCIDDADALRSGGTARVLGCALKAPSTLGTFLRSFRWGHVRQLDRVSRDLLGRAREAGAGPGAAPEPANCPLTDQSPLCYYAPLTLILPHEGE